MTSYNDKNATNAPRITIDWAVEGLQYGLQHDDIIVIVDTLRFSTATATACALGYTIYPVKDSESGKKLAADLQAILAVRSDEPGISISPVSIINAPAVTYKRIVLPSPNGAACSAHVERNHTVIIGCFLNAEAIAETAASLAHAYGKNITVIACGEQRSVVSGGRVTYDLEESHRVFAIEDYLGAGAIINHCKVDKTAEAEVCARAFLASQNSLFSLIRESFSGRYLVENGLEEDIKHAVQMNLYHNVPKVYCEDLVYIK